MCVNRKFLIKHELIALQLLSIFDFRSGFTIQIFTRIKESKNQCVVAKESEDEEEKCSLYGGVSYTDEADFRIETTDDWLEFHLSVRPERFARYTDQIRASQIDEVILTVSGVPGLYSEWSPSITTDEIKVLTEGKEHEVEARDGCEIVPPRLGEVKKYSLYTKSITKFEAPVDALHVDDDLVDEEDSSGEVSPQENDARLVKLLTSINEQATILPKLLFVAYLIAALLLLILIV